MYKSVQKVAFQGMGFRMQDFGNRNLGDVSTEPVKL